MTANPSPHPAALDELEGRLARLGLSAGSVKGRQDALPSALQEFHRRLLGAFLAEVGSPDAAVVDRLAEPTKQRRILGDDQGKPIR